MLQADLNSQQKLIQKIKQWIDDQQPPTGQQPPTSQEKDINYMAIFGYSFLALVILVLLIIIGFIIKNKTYLKLKFLNKDGSS
jgi:uncharacterized integral membrane protein